MTSAALSVVDTQEPEWTTLREHAERAMRNAYAPYSGFHVGAALLAADGTISAGCNVENASYPASICAERAAVGTAVAGGARSFVAIVIATDADAPTPPCGICRQVLTEFSADLQVESVTRSGQRARWILADLLPYAFNPGSLERKQRADVSTDGASL